MGFLDKLSKRVQDAVEDKIIDNAEDKAENTVDKAMDADTYTKKESAPAAAPAYNPDEFSSAMATSAPTSAAEFAPLPDGAITSPPSDIYSEKKQCPNCRYITKFRYCGKCGKDLSTIQYMTSNDLAKLDRRRNR